jgi:transcriptional regulator with XRE-family HTH domain
MATITRLNPKEWVTTDQPGGHNMPLGDRIQQLRKERGWSQAELATRIDSDARQVSRYENDKITPSLDALARIAETLDISLDYLVFDHAPRRPLHTPTTGIDNRLAAIAELNPQDLDTITNTIDALTTRARLRTITN